MCDHTFTQIKKYLSLKMEFAIYLEFAKHVWYLIII